jgi:hypothetical protein
LSYEVAQGLELVDELAHGLRAHVCAAGELGEPRAGRVDLREHGRVRGLLWESGADDPVDDAEAELAVRLTQHGHCVGSRCSLLHHQWRQPDRPCEPTDASDRLAAAKPAADSSTRGAPRQRPSIRCSGTALPTGSLPTR